MSGNTGTLKATPSENSNSSFERTVTIVKELAIGDEIEGLDADKQPALCTVEAIGMFGQGAITATTPRTTSCSTPPRATSCSTARSATAPSRTSTR